LSSEFVCLIVIELKRVPNEMMVRLNISL